MTSRRDESGVALLIVLLVITLLTVVVVELTYSAQIETHLTFSGRNALQATYLARSGINLAEALIQFDPAYTELKYTSAFRDTDSDRDVWAEPAPPAPVGDGTVAVRVRDEARAINFNDLLAGGTRVAPAQEAAAGRVFDGLGIDRAVLHAIIDWIDQDSEPYPSPPGAEQPFYLQMTPPIRIRNAPLLTMRELRLVRGVTEKVLDDLDEVFTVVPSDSKKQLRVNINTAKKGVLMAFVDPATADRIIAERSLQPFNSTMPADMPDLKAAITAAAGNMDWVRYDSTYFRIDTVGTVNDVHRGIAETVQRGTQGLRPQITRLTWFPNATPASLTSQPPSDFLRTLPPLGGSS